MTKVIIVGDAGVGKTNLLNRKFEEKYIKSDRIKQYKFGNFEIYDTPGESKFNITSYYPNINFNHCIIMYDVTNSMSYKSVEYWKKTIKELYSDIKITVIGNKIDSKYRKIYDGTSLNISTKNTTIENILSSVA